MRRDIVGFSRIIDHPSCTIITGTIYSGARGSISVAEGDMGIEGISVSENQDLVWLMVQTRAFSLSIPILPKTIHISNGVATIRF